MPLLHGSADKDPHSIDKLSNLAESRPYLRNALPPYAHSRAYHLRLGVIDTYSMVLGREVAIFL